VTAQRTLAFVVLWTTPALKHKHTNGHILEEAGHSTTVRVLYQTNRVSWQSWAEAGLPGALMDMDAILGATGAMPSAEPAPALGAPGDPAVPTAEAAPALPGAEGWRVRRARFHQASRAG
jgi:hypothetical protein